VFLISVLYNKLKNIQQKGTLRKMEESPGVKLLLRLKRPWLVIKAKELKLNLEGTKIELARRINKAQRKEQEKIWRSISGRGLK